MVYYVHASHYIHLSKVVGECFGERADNEFLKTAIQLFVPAILTWEYLSYKIVCVNTIKSLFCSHIYLSDIQPHWLPLVTHVLIL